MGRPRRERISEAIGHLHMQPLPDALLGVRPTQRESRTFRLTVTFTQREGAELVWLAGYLGTNASSFIRELAIKGLETEGYQKALRER